jgi:hypothetical protein
VVGTACRISVQSSDLIHDVKDTVSKALKITNAKRNPLQVFDLIVAAFGETVGIEILKSIEYVLSPMKPNIYLRTLF